MTSTHRHVPAVVGIGDVLRRNLGRYDMILLTVAATIGIDTIAQIASVGGAQAFTWAAVIVVAFLFPYGLLMAETGSSFRQEGGPYVWVRLAFGRFAGGMASLLYWVTNPIWLGGSLAFIFVETWDHYLTPITAGSLGDYALKLAFVWVTIAVAVIGLKYGKWVVNIGAIVKVGLIAVFAVTVVLYALENGVRGYPAGDFSPTTAGFLAVTPIMLFAFVGFEAQSGAAEEMRNPQRDVPISIGFAGVISVLCYLVPIFGILAVIPPAEITGASGFLDAVGAVFSVYGAAAPAMLTLAAVAFLFAVLTQGGAWMIASDRVQAIASAEGAFPNYFGRFSHRFGTPVRVNMLSGGIASVFCIAATLVAGGAVASLFAVVLTVAITTLLMSYLLIIPAAVRLRTRFPDVGRPFRIPGGAVGIRICGAVVTAWVALGTWVALFPGVLESWLGLDYDFVGSWGVDRLAFEVFTIGTLVVLLAIGAIGYALSRRDMPLEHAHQERTHP